METWTMNDILRYTFTNQTEIETYIRNYGKIETIKALRIMFDEDGKRIPTEPDIIKGETRVPTNGNLGLLEAKFFVDYVVGRVAERNNYGHN